MDEEKKKTIMLALVVVCLVLAAAIFVFTRPKKPNTGPVPMICEECDNEYSLGREEFKEQLMATGLVSPMRIDPIPLVCPACNEEAAYAAKTCPECKINFLENLDSEDGFRDRCPECGFSKVEARIEARRNK